MVVFLPCLSRSGLWLALLFPVFLGKKLVLAAPTYIEKLEAIIKNDWFPELRDSIKISGQDFSPLSQKQELTRLARSSKSRFLFFHTVNGGSLVTMPVRQSNGRTIFSFFVLHDNNRVMPYQKAAVVSNVDHDALLAKFKADGRHGDYSDMLYTQKLDQAEFDAWVARGGFSQVPQLPPYRPRRQIK